MLLGDVCERFVQPSPLTVMVRGLLEQLRRPDQLDTRFAATANRPYTRPRLCSALVDLRGWVVCTVRPSIHAAFASRKEAMGARLTAGYDQLNHLAPATAAAMVRCTAPDAAAVLDARGGRRPEGRPGSTVRIVEGNRLTGTEHRLEARRRTTQGAWPGQALLVFDPVRGGATDVVPGADAPAPERSLLEGGSAVIRERDRWIADRNCGTARLVFAVAARAAGGSVRQQRGAFAWEPVGKRRRAGRPATGTVLAQTVRVAPDGTPRWRRRITVVRDEPAPAGDRERHLLTNVPVADADPGQGAAW